MNRFIAVIAAMAQGLLDEIFRKSRLMIPRRGGERMTQRILSLESAAEDTSVEETDRQGDNRRH